MCTKQHLCYSNADVFVAVVVLVVVVAHTKGITPPMALLTLRTFKILYGTQFRRVCECVCVCRSVRHCTNVCAHSTNYVTNILRFYSFALLVTAQRTASLCAIRRAAPERSVARALSVEHI